MAAPFFSAELPSKTESMILVSLPFTYTAPALPEGSPTKLS